MLRGDVEVRLLEDEVAIGVDAQPDIATGVGDGQPRFLASAHRNETVTLAGLILRALVLKVTNNGSKPFATNLVSPPRLWSWSTYMP